MSLNKMNIKKNKPKRTAYYGLFPQHIKETKDFDDSTLFNEKVQMGILLKSLKIYFIRNQKLLGLESSFVNFITGERKQSEYHGGDKNSKDIIIKDITVGNMEYIKNVEFALDENFETINYLKIITSKENEIEFGEKKGKALTILNFEGDNMIQCFYGNYDKDGINNIGFQYIDKIQFSFYNIFPILKLRFKFNHDEEFKKKYESNYKELLKDDISNVYLYRTCILPDSLFAKILKYC